MHFSKGLLVPQRILKAFINVPEQFFLHSYTIWGSWINARNGCVENSKLLEKYISQPYIPRENTLKRISPIIRLHKNAHSHIPVSSKGWRSLYFFLSCGPCPYPHNYVLRTRGIITNLPAIDPERCSFWAVKLSPSLPCVYLVVGSDSAWQCVGQSCQQVCISKPNFIVFDIFSETKVVASRNERRVGEWELNCKSFLKDTRPAVDKWPVITQVDLLDAGDRPLSKVLFRRIALLHPSARILIFIGFKVISQYLAH